MDLYLIRHTRVAAPGLCYGRLDVPLADSFAEEAAALELRLRNLGPLSFYCSPADRCRRLAEYLGLAPVIDPRLQELDFGRWEGMPWDAIGRPALDAWAADFVCRPCPGGESYAALIERVAAFLGELTAQGVGRAGVITHAGVIRAARVLLQGVAPEESFRLPVPNGEPIALLGAASAVAAGRPGQYHPGGHPPLPGGEGPGERASPPHGANDHPNQ